MTEAYLTSQKNLGQILQTIKNARAPERFTQKFLTDLGFKSTPDRLIINVLKGLGFLDSNGAPTEMYSRFLDDTQSKYILAEGIKKAYNDLFELNVKAYDLSNNEVKNKFKTIFAGSTKSDDVLSKMATTFKALCQLADFSNTDVVKKPEEPRKEETRTGGFFNHNFEDPNLIPLVQKHINTDLHYNIQIHLPETRDLAVYDAIFESLKKHLL